MKLPPGPWSMLLGYVVLSVMPIPVRLVGERGWGSASTTFMRFALGSLAVLVLWRLGGQAIHTTRPLILFLRGLFGGISVLLYFVAVQRTGAGMGTLLNYTHSIWSNLFGLLLLRHRPPRHFWPMLGLAFIGLWLVIDPSFDRLELGKLLGLLSGMIGGLAIQCIKKLRQTDSALTLMASFCGVGMVLAMLLLPLEGVDQKDVLDGAVWSLLFAIAALSFAGQMLFTHGYRDTSVARGSLLSLLTPTLASLSSWAFLGERLGLRYAVGATLVLTACALFGWLENGHPATEG